MIDTIESTNEKHLPSVINKDNDQMKQQNNINHENNHASNEDHHSHNDNNSSSSSYIHQKVGIALLLGYLFMLLVDQMSYTILELTCCQTILFGLKNLCYHSILYIPLMNRFNNNNNNTSTVISNSMNTTNSTSNNTNNLSNETSINNNNNNSSNCSSINSIQSINHKGLIVTCGLVIHSLADGLAIGSAFALNQLQLELILFLAIILHKVSKIIYLIIYLFMQKR